jgi:FdhD protein
VSASDRRLPITGAVLAGGRSERMGADKVLLLVDGEPLLLRVVDVVGRVCDERMVVLSEADVLEGVELPEDVRVLTDEVPFLGPLGGLTTALAAAEHEWILAVAADLAWRVHVGGGGMWEARDGAQAVVPVSEAGTEPLLALYHRSCLAVAREVLGTGRRRFVAMFPRLRVAEVPLESLRRVDPDLSSLINVNTPEELAAARHAVPERDDRVRVSLVGADVRGGRLPIERPVTVMMNDTEIATMQATPEQLDDLAVGFLVAEGLLSDRAALESVAVDPVQGMVWVRTSEEPPDPEALRKRYLTSGCGKGVTFASAGHMEGITQVEGGGVWDADTIYRMPARLSRAAEKYRDTGGMHACGLVVGATLLIVREDVGRHNALDKLLGRAWLDGVETEDAVVASTGRISYEMAVKVAKAGIRVAVSRTAVTVLAVDVAEHAGITLAGYARGGRMVVYTHPGRIRIEEDDE